ncbi:MAG: AAA family ATPase [Bosea sp. (in: a-proteobacteria)]
MSARAEIVEFLASRHGFGSDGGCKTVVTHISTVLLIGERAIKLKHPVRLPYLDFSTPERRLQACLDELRLNRRTAPTLYRAVHRITREADGRLALNGQGRLEDAVVEMARFDERTLFDRLAREGRLSLDDADALAKAIAALHGDAQPVAGAGAERMARVLALNETALRDVALFGPCEVQPIILACRQELERLQERLDQRARAGFVRRCHGDLHLRNICKVDGAPTLFDCLEFSEELATTDILYDLAFVLMDLWRRKLPVHANTLFNRYVDETGDEAGAALLPFFMAVRAMVRAHVTAAEIGATELSCAWIRSEARSYLALARDLLAIRPASLVAIGGFSGSGKSSVATRIAPQIGPAPGARILASDRIRKHLFGVPAETPLGAEAYAPALSETVYETALACADIVLAAGHAVICEAVFDRPSARAAVETLAQRRGVPFRPLWLEAPADLLMRRVAARRHDPSDATPEVVMSQLAKPTPPHDWPRLCTTGDLETVCEAAQLATDVQVTISLAAPCAQMRIPSRALAPLTCARALAKVEARPPSGARTVGADGLLRAGATPTVLSLVEETDRRPGSPRPRPPG